MALQIWMPMVSDFNNQGLQNSTITNNSVTLDNNGKLGKCGKFTGSNYISGTINLGDSIEYTLACWVKPPDVSAGNKQIVAIAPNSGWANCRATMFYRQNTAEFIATLSNGTDSLGYTMGMTATPNVWQHIAVTFKNKTMIWYSNGVVQKTLTTTIDPKFSDITAFGIGGASNGAEKFTGYINDVRIYDHALSPKEIEILSRGLVCHYPLNGGGRGGDNLLKNTGDLTLWAKEAGITTTWDSEKNLYKIVDSTHTSNRWGIYQDINIEANTSYTITCTLNGDNCAVAFGFYDSSTSFPGNLITVTDSTTKRLSYTVTSGASSTKARVYLNINCANSATKTAWFGTPKVEKGSVSTPWIPNSADTAYSAMGYNSTTEYDVSGYQNNMTKTGTITYTSDSARYSVAPHFINGSYLMANQNCTEYLPTDGLTVNLWIKATTWGTPISCTEGGGWNIESYNNGLQFQCMITSVGYKPAWCNVTAASITDNKWHMLTGTFDRTAQQTKIYIDGVLKGTGNTGSTYGISYVANRLIISGEAQSTTPTSSYFVGEESDVRIYATALSATQVAELYNTAVSVANNGTLLGYELVEV